MAISLGDIKKKKLKVPTVEVNSSEKINIKKAPSLKTNNQTISLADIKSGKSKIEPIKESTKTHAQQYNLDGSKKIAPTVSITTNNIANKGATNLINNALQQDIKNKTLEIATGQNKQKINLAGDSSLTKSQKQELREKTAEEKEKINANLPQMASADSIKNKGDDLVKDMSKKTGYSEQEVTDFINDYNNGRWDSTQPKYRNASYKFKDAGTEVYLVAKEYEQYKPTSNKKLSPLENTTQSSVNALIETGKGIVDFSEGVLDAGIQLGSSKYNPMMWITTGQTPWSKDQSKLDNYQDIAKEIVSKDASQNFIDNELGYGKKLSNGKIIQETLDEGALIKSDNLGGQVFRNIGAQLPGLMTGTEAGSLATMGISSFGSGVEQAYNQGATRGEATGYGLLNSTIEVATEKMFSGVGGILGKGEIDDAIINGINKNIKNELAQKLISFGIKSLGEGAEEVLGDLLQPLAQKLTYSSEEDLMKLYKDQNYLEDFVSGVLSAAIMQGSTIPINNQNQMQIKNQVKEIVNKDNANQIFNDILKNNKNLSEWEVANIVNNALKETNQKTVDFSKNVVQNETTQETNSNTPQISQEIEQNQELSNETINNSQNTQYSQIENNKKKIAPIIIKYEKSDNQKINNYRQSAIREGLYDNEKTRSLMNVSEKLIQEKGYNIVFDRTITNEKGQPVNAQIKPLDNGEIEIRVNPNSERAGEFLLIHEVSHAIKTQDMIDYVNKFASKNKTFAESVKSLEQQYGKDLTNEEVFADVCGQLFGNQEFIDSLVVENTPQSKNIIKKVYESIKRLLNNFTTEGRYKNFVQELETKWREAYKNTSTKQAISNLNNETKYAQKTLKDGTQYIETEKNLFTKDDGTAMSQREIYNSLIGKKITFNDGITATIKQWLPNNKNMYNELFKRYPNYKNVNDIKGVNKNINENIVELLENSNNVSSNEPDYMNRHKDNKINSFDTRKVSFFDGKNAYDLDFSIAKMQDGNYVAYAKKNLSANNELLNKIKKEAPTSKSRGVLPYADNISQNRNNVKSDISSTKYSMQESTNNTQELDNSSFSLKQKQLDIILKNNPVQDDYHTWIRTVDDIKTLEETIADSDWADYDEFNPDLTKQDIEDAINSGKIMVYSSYPIGQGIFVSPSRMEAESYSSDGKVYSKEVNIDDVAWIDPTQGQYAKVQEKIAKNNLNVDNQGRTLTKEQYEYFKDSKVRDKKGKLEVMYRGDTGETINVFDKNKSKKSNLYGTGFYFSDESMASLYGNTTPYYLNIVNPLYVNKDTHNITKEQYSNFIKLAIENEDYSFENYGNMSTDELINKLYDGRSDFKLINDVVATAMGDYRDAFDVFEKANGIKYDGIISNSQTVVFDSNQIKNVDNTNPTSNADIRYSQENQTWQEHLEENYKATGTRTYFNEIADSNKKILAPIHKETKKKISAPITRENNEINESIKDDVIKVKPSKESISLAKTINEAIKQDIIVEKGKETKQRRWIDTSLQSDVVEGKILLEDLDPKKTTYVVQSNKKSLDKANNKLNQMGYEESVEYIKIKMNDSKVSLTDVVLAQRLIQEAIQRGDTVIASDLIMDTAILGTDLGQKIQALSMIQRLTPEGQLRMFQKIVKRAKTMGDKSYDNVEITPEMVELILGAYKSNGTFDQTDLNNRVEQFKQKVAEQMETTTGEKIVAWRYLSMLGNPKTHIRNVVSNIAMYGTLKVKNAMARTIETAIPMNSRTKTWKKSSDAVKDFAKITTNEMKDIISGEGKYSEKTSLESKKKIFNNKVLEGVSNFNSNMLSAEDWFFSKRAFESTLREYLTANGIKTNEDIQNNPELIEKAKQYAVEQAEIATFRQYSKIASAISKFERKHKVAGLAVSATIPFKKTPVNIAKTGVKYSPIGLIKSATYDAYRLKTGEINASQFVDNLSQGLTGTSLTLIGYVLAKAGILKGAGDDDKEGKFDSYLGKQTYSINIGGQSFSISWLSPVAMPLLVGANAYEQLEEQKEWDMNIVVDTLTQTLDPLSEMSFISGLTDTLNSYQSSPTKMISSVGTSMVQNYVSQFFPTLLSQIAATFDDTKRTTRASNNSKFKEGEETVRMLMYKIPGLRNLLEPSTDIWGNEVKQSKNIVQRAFENFIAPYSRKEDTSTKLDKELKRVYQETGESSVIPGIPYAYTQYDKVKYQMSAKEYTQYKKTYGETANEILNLLIKEKNYKDSSDTRKARMIEKAFKYATELSKAEFLEGRDIEFDEDDFKSASMSYSEMSDYIIRNTRYLDGER